MFERKSIQPVARRRNRTRLPQSWFLEGKIQTRALAVLVNMGGEKGVLATQDLVYLEEVCNIFGNRAIAVRRGMTDVIGILFL